MTHTVSAEIVASVLSVAVAPEQRVSVGDELVLLDSMKMEIPVLADVAGTVREVLVQAGDTVREGDPLVILKRG